LAETMMPIKFVTVKQQYWLYVSIELRQKFCYPDRG